MSVYVLMTLCETFYLMFEVDGISVFERALNLQILFLKSNFHLRHTCSEGVFLRIETKSHFIGGGGDFSHLF